MAQPYGMPRSSLQRLMIEILYQLLNTEHSSNDYVVARLQKAGLSLKEIKDLLETEC